MLISLKAGSGEAVTSVVTEFRQKTDSNPLPFKIEMEFCSELDSEDLIRELVWSYRQLYLPDIDKASGEEFNKISKESQVAWSSLQAAFGHHRELKSLCDKKTQGANAEIIEKLLAWKNELEWPAGHEDGRWEHFVESADECCDLTSGLMQDKYWPFIKVIRFVLYILKLTLCTGTDETRIFLQTSVLENGLILVDLPGMR